MATINMHPLPLVPKTEDIVPMMRKMNLERKAVIDAIVKSVKPETVTFDNVLKPLAKLNDAQSGPRSIVAALRYAAPETSTQRAVEHAENLPREEQGDIEDREDFYVLVKAVQENSEMLDGEDRKLIEVTLDRFAGHRLKDKASGGDQKLLEIEQEIQNLCTLFNRNIRQNNAGSLLFTESELDGLAPEHISTYLLSDDGKRSVPVQEQELQTILYQAHNSETREKMLQAWSGRLKENAPLFARVIKLRHQSAKILGYRTFAESVIEDRMTDSVDWILDLLRQLGDAMIPAGQENLALLTAEKRNHFGKEVVELDPWDVEYYNRRIDQRNAVDLENIAEYFPLEHAFNSMLEIFGTNLQMEFIPVPSSELTGHVWSNDLSVFAVYDKRAEYEGEFIGYLYRDIHQRPNKFKHNQAVCLQPGFVKSDESRMYPAVTIICSLGDVSKHGCYLLTHRQVQSLFHELGHCIHSLVSRTQFSRFHGYWVKLEFGEAIGTMLEQWVWNPEVLKTISRHYTSLDKKFADAWLESHPKTTLLAESLPDDVLQALVQMRKRSRLMLHLQQLSESAFDLAVHHPADDKFVEELDAESLDAIYDSLQRRYLGISRPDLGYMHTSFNHLMSGMAAGYYAYICANVFAEEMYQAVFSNGRHGDVDSWDKFRRGILEPGGSRDELQMIREFCGKAPSSDALLMSVGLK